MLKLNIFRYVRSAREPIPDGCALVHNNVAHTDKTRPGVRGFRAWTQPLDDTIPPLEPCECGWSGRPHYRVRQDNP